ncbi:MAG: diguanylate cyclase [Armatimonadetes bacterium]|nr:diguanylate cyclase [Armatimonadota bacterium]
MSLNLFKLLLIIPALLLLTQSLIQQPLSFLLPQLLFAALLVCAGFSTRISFMRHRIEITFDSALVPFWIFIWGPNGALAMSLNCIMAMTILRRWKLMLPAASVHYMSYYLGGMVYLLLGGALIPKALSGQMLLAMAASFLVMQGFGLLSSVIYLALKEGTPIFKISRSLLYYSIPDALLFPINIVAVLIWANWGAPHLLLLIIPLVATIWILKLALKTSSERQELNALYSFGETLQPLVEQDEVFRALADAASGSGMARNLLVTRMDRERAALVPMEARGLFAAQTQGEFPIRADQELRVVEEGKTLVIADLSNHPLRPYLAESIRSLLVVPLITGAKVEGAILAGHEKADFFHEDHTRFLSLLANQVTFTFVRVELYQRLLQSSLTDETTGLYNKRYFLKALDTEIQRSERYGPPFSLLAFDIDDFKKINDSCGHLQGDQVLKDLSRVARLCIREGVDIVARTGGEEFHIVLPATHWEQARIVGERLRICIERYPFLGDFNPIKVTVSIGVVTYPHHSEEARGLLQEADDALYEAKRTGKNRLCVHEAGPPPKRASGRGMEVPPNLVLKDEATGFLTHDYFLFRLREELRRSDRYEAPCSLIILWPSEKGNVSAVRWPLIAAQIQTSIRVGIDVPTLLPDREIAILLPETNQEQVTLIADRLCRGLSLQFKPEYSQIAHGVATYPKEALTEDELFRRARRR